MSNTNDSQTNEFAQLCRSTLTAEAVPNSIDKIERLDVEIDKVGPWWLGHFLVNSDDEQTNTALTQYLEAHWPHEAATIDQMITATQWRRTANGAERDFGGD